MTQDRTAQLLDADPRLRRAHGRDDLLGAARVWAAATSARDAFAEPASADAALQVLRPVASRPGSVLVVAARGQDVVGFALAAPDHGSSAEIWYLGVAPEHWGAALGGLLVTRMRDELRADGFARACLWVYADNARAIRLYERTGWTRDAAAARHHARSGRLELRYEQALDDC